MNVERPDLERLLLEGGGPDEEWDAVLNYALSLDSEVNRLTSSGPDRERPASDAASGPEVLIREQAEEIELGRAKIARSNAYYYETQDRLHILKAERDEARRVADDKAEEIERLNKTILRHEHEVVPDYVAQLEELDKERYEAQEEIERA